MFELTFMAEHSTIDIYIFKKCHLNTNITVKSSKDLFVSPWYLRWYHSDLVLHYVFLGVIINP